MHTTERSEKVTNSGPHAFTTVGMHLSHPISIVVSRPFLSRVAYNKMLSRPLDAIIARPFVSTYYRLRCGVERDMPDQHCRRSSMSYSQTYLLALSAYRTDNRRSVILVVAVPSSLVGSPTRRVPPVEMLLTFFPPHSETSRLSQYAHHREECWAAKLGHWLAGAYVSGVRCFSQALALPLWWLNSLLSTLPLSATLPAVGLDASPRRSCLNRCCISADTHDIYTLVTCCDEWFGSVEPALLEPCIEDWGNAAPAHGSARLSIGCSVGGLLNRLLEIPYPHFTTSLHYFHT